MKTIFTFGYANFKAVELLAFVQQTGAMVLDTRFKPWSREGEWRAKALKERFGASYNEAGKWFGNENYKGGPIKLVNPEGLRKRVVRLLDEQPIVLLCQCWAFQTCHRRVVAETIHGWCGAPIHHLTRIDVPKIDPKKDTETLDLPF